MEYLQAQMSELDQDAACLDASLAVNCLCARLEESSYSDDAPQAGNRELPLQRVSTGGLPEDRSALQQCVVVAAPSSRGGSALPQCVVVAAPSSSHMTSPIYSTLCSPTAVPSPLIARRSQSAMSLVSSRRRERSSASRWSPRHDGLSPRETESSCHTPPLIHRFLSPRASQQQRQRQQQQSPIHELQHASTASTASVEHSSCSRRLTACSSRHLNSCAGASPPVSNPGTPVYPSLSPLPPAPAPAGISFKKSCMQHSSSCSTSMRMHQRHQTTAGKACQAVVAEPHAARHPVIPPVWGSSEVVASPIKATPAGSLAAPPGGPNTPAKPSVEAIAAALTQRLASSPVPMLAQRRSPARGHSASLLATVSSTGALKNASQSGSLTLPVATPATVHCSSAAGVVPSSLCSSLSTMSAVPRTFSDISLAGSARAVACQVPAARELSPSVPGPVIGLVSRMSIVQTAGDRGRSPATCRSSSPQERHSLQRQGAKSPSQPISPAPSAGASVLLFPGLTSASSAAKADDGPLAHIAADPGTLMQSPFSKQAPGTISSAPLQTQRPQRASLTPSCAVVSATTAAATSRTRAHSRSPTPNCPASNRSSLAMTPRPARAPQLVIARQDKLCDSSSHRPVVKQDGSLKALSASLACPVTAETSVTTSGGSVLLSTAGSVSTSWEAAPSIDRTLDGGTLSASRLPSPLTRTKAGVGVLRPAQQWTPPMAEVIARPELALGDQPTTLDEFCTLPLGTPVATSPLTRCMARMRSKDRRVVVPFESKENWPPPPLLVRSSKGLTSAAAGCGSFRPVA